MSQAIETKVLFFRRTMCPVCWGKLINGEGKLAWMEKVLLGVSSREEQITCSCCGQEIKAKLLFSDNPRAVADYRTQVRIKKNLWWARSLFSPIA